MVVTDEQVAMLRAHLTGNDVEYTRLGAGPAPADFQPGFNALVATSFVDVANLRFGMNRPMPAIIQFVASVRAEYIEEPDLLDPIAAERLLRAALGDTQAVINMDDETKARGQAFLLPALVEELDDAQLDALLIRARNQAENLPG